jgi:hypothetical protein
LVAFALIWTGLVADSDLLAGLADGFPLAKQNVGSPKLLKNLFGVVSFFRHGSDLISWLFTTFDLDQIFRARSSSHLHFSSFGLRGEKCLKK